MAESLDLARTAALAANEKLATDIAVIEVSQLMPIVDYFVFASGDNERQVSAIVDEVEDALRELDAKPVRREGVRDARWVLLDYGDIVVHIMREKEREYYGLDRLWKDAPLVEIPELAEAARSDVADETSVRNVESVEDLPLATTEPDADEI